jgi:predicted double-glycine peptidase
LWRRLPIKILDVHFCWAWTRVLVQRIEKKNVRFNKHTLKFVTLSILLVGCWWPAAILAASPVFSIYEQRNQLVVRQNFDLSCGAAALATLLVFQHGETLSERDVAIGLVSRDLYLNNPEILKSRQGFSLFDMSRYVESLGYQGDGLGQLQFEDLASRAPIILAMDFTGYRHFVVYRGHLGNRVLLADPAYGLRTMKLSRFMQPWIEFPELGRVGFRVIRRDNLFPPNRLAPRSEDFVTLN